MKRNDNIASSLLKTSVLFGYLLSIPLGTGLHMHCLRAHDDKSANGDGFVVHAHESTDPSGDQDVEASFHRAGAKHSHHVATLQLVAVRAPTQQTPGSFSAQIDQQSILPFVGALASHPSFNRLRWFGSDPPLLSVAYATASGRSPPSA